MKRNSKLWLLITALVLLVTVSVGGTLAYLTVSTESVTNVFTPATVGTEIEETVEGNVKKEVTVKNTGDIPAYIRAMIVVTWQDNAGDVYSVAPKAGTDYTISIGPDWTKQGDFYYYNLAVDAEASTTNLITTCSPVVGKAPDGYDLHVEILVQSVQAEPVDAAEELWGYVPAPPPLTKEA